MISLVCAILLGLLIVIFPITAGVITQVLQISSENTVNMISAISFALASIVGLLIYSRKYYSNYEKISIIPNESIDFKGSLYFIPLIIAVLANFVNGIKDSITMENIFTLLLLCIFVGIAEEVFFRGIIFKTLRKSFSLNKAVIISTLLFSILHLTRIIPTLMGSTQIQSLAYTIAQIIFAFLFGLAAAKLSLACKSLLPAIIWHSTHDFTSFISVDTINTKAIIALVIQCAIIMFYVIYLNKAHKVDRNKQG